MDMAIKINKFASLLLLIPALPAFAGEWSFDPSIALKETYSDNVNLSIIDPQSSLISQVIAGLNTNYNSKLAEFNFKANKSYVFYSHDSELDDDYRTLSTDGSLSFWEGGPQLVASASIANINRSNATNSLADLVSGGTIEAINYSAGLIYQTQNSSYIFDSSFMLSVVDNEDDIADSKGYAIKINTGNGRGARNVFWNMRGNYSDRDQTESSLGGGLVGTNYTVDATIGAITPYDLNPFIRFYNEEITGNTQSNINTTPSWGPGLRWQASPHVIFDVSYNFVFDEEVSDDYLAGEVSWQPSARTSLIAGFSQRFFGKSYNLSFTHSTRRLTNSIMYDEKLQVFDRNNYQNTTVGTFWCPVGSFTGEISQCYAQADQPGSDEYELVSLSGLELLQSNEFSLNKTFSWRSELALSRTTFTFNASGLEREGLESGIIDENYDLNFQASRQISSRSSLSFSLGFRYSIFDKDNPNGSRQEDYYRSISSTYRRSLASSLSTFFTLQYLDRDSNIDAYKYQEIRAIINIKKDF